MTFDVLLVALAALVLSNVVLLVAAARSGVLDIHVRSSAASTGEMRSRDRGRGSELGDVSRRTTSATPAVGRNWVAASPTPGSGPSQQDVAARMRAAPLPAPARPEPPAPTRDLGPERAVGSEPSVAEDEIERLLDAAAIEVAAEKHAAKAAPIEPELIEPELIEPAAIGENAALVTPTGAEGSSAASVDRPETAQPARGGARGGRRAAGNGKRGRRFTLPSIEVDHERTERVVLSLLSGEDEPAGGQLVDAWERLVGGEADVAGGRAATVVALALDGLDTYAESGGRDAAERLVGGVLDAIRRSARGSDRVASVGRGRFRVLLVDADSDVASRFVARVRELADRRISLSAAPVRIAAGWAEATSAGGLDAAVRAAEDQRRRNLAAGSAAKRDVSPA